MIHCSDFRFKHFLLISVHKGILDSGEIQHLVSRIKDELKEAIYTENLALLTSAAALAYRGLLKDVEEVFLHEVNLSTIPTDHLISLMSSVTDTFDIYDNVTGCDLVTILDSLQCNEIGLGFNDLGKEEEAQALVRAMESRVERLYIHDTLGMDIHVRNLTEYSGQGRCRVLECKGVTDVFFCYELIKWASKTEWHFLRHQDEEDEELNDPESEHEEEEVLKFRIYLTKV